MRGVDLHTGEAGLFCHHCSTSEAMHDIVYIRLAHLPRHLEHSRQGTEFQRNRRRRHGRLAHAGQHLPAGMVDLQPELRPSATPRTGPLTEPLQLPVVFQYHTAGTSQCAAIDHDVATEDQAYTAIGPGLVQTQQFI